MPEVLLQGNADRSVGLSGVTPRLYQRATDLLGRQLEHGMLPVGTRVTEAMVAEQFGISRAPARQALMALERRGLLSKNPHKGYEVLDDGKSAGKPKDSSSALEGQAEAVRLQPVPSWERIYADVEDEIVARISFGSWRINEAKLARHYRVSRTVARDVVGRLQQRGILRKDERSRWYAPALTPAHIGELYELRAILEPVALRKAAPNIPAGFLQTLRGHLESAIAKKGDVGGATLDRLEEELHVALLSYCGSQPLTQAITGSQSLLVAHRFLYRWTPRLFKSEPFLPEHLDVVRLLESGDTAGAAAALEKHLLVSSARAIARVDAIRRNFAVDPLPYLDELGG